MTKTELVEAIAKGAELTKAEASNALNVILSSITDTLQKGEQVVLTGFGTFKTTNRSERQGRNPQTGEAMLIKAACVPKFTPGKALKDAVQGEEVATA